MTTIDLTASRSSDAGRAAAIVAAGTAVLLAPIDPQFLRPTEATAPATPRVPNFTALLLAHAHAHAEADRVAKVNKALGFSTHSIPSPFLGETATSLTMWSQHELNTVYERVGGAITTRTVQRTSHSGESTWDAIEITLTVQVPGVGPVKVSTDWDEESGGHDLPLVRGLALPEAMSKTMPVAQVAA
ncbi:hypothetical protein [Streptomyces sp. AD55]|uniref:hypothetical protein n=1 Tax=Streptomyces sp. AD55 TaxID=3242895 RepID=UPI0035285B36